MNKELVSGIIGTSISLLVVFWLVDGNLWLKLFLGLLLAESANLYQKLKYLQQLFEIADAELVRVSSLAGELENKVNELEDKIKQIGEGEF